VKPSVFMAAVAASCIAASAAAQYPNKPIRIVNPFAAGGGGDIATRMVAQKVSENTGKTLVVENKTGAGGRVGYEAAARATPDGYTIVASDTTYTMIPGLYGGYPWGSDLDLVPITILVQNPFLVVASPALKINSLQELIAAARARPGKLNYGSAGIGSVNHVSTELFKREAGIDLTHIPYKGMGDAITGLLTGSLDVLIIGIAVATPHISSGKMIPLAVAAPKRSPSLPAVPSVVEAGLPGFIAGNWFAWSAPKGTPREAVDWLQREAAKALESPDIKERVMQQGAEASGISPEEFATVVRSDLQRWSDVIRAARIRLE
jgi:tripartite-type tricarboxylate transporter receptor subunit TctC